MTDHPDYFIAAHIEIAERVTPDHAGIAVGFMDPEGNATRWLLTYDHARDIRDWLVLHFT